MRLDIEGAPFENVFIYVSDALRYDSIAERVTEHGDAIRTASSGLATPESMSSIVSGLYPPQHGVWKFTSRLDDSLTTVFDVRPEQSLILGYNDDVLRNMLGQPDSEGTPVENIETPFTLVVKDDYAHSPYGVNLESPNPEFESHPEYWQHRASDEATFRAEYADGAAKSAERFEVMLNQLDDRDLLSDTLVIYTSDHGELLGEHGLVDHGAPIRPELVYVPTVFCNDRVSVDGDFMAHVDILPTVLLC